MSKKPRQSRRQRNTHQLKQRSRRAFQAERLEDRMMLAGDLHNAFFPVDTNDDGVVGSGDALAVINDLNRYGIRALDSNSVESGEAEGGSAKMVDVDNDKHVTPSDVRRVVNALNAEGETGPVLQVITRIFERPLNYPTVEATNEISTIGVGQDFVVKLLVEDIRSMGTREGVFSTYVDVNFDNPAIASLVPSLPGVNHPQTGNPTPYLHNLQGGYGERAEPSSGDGLIDTDNNGSLDQLDFVGSFAGVLRGPGPGEFVLVEWAMTANTAGTLTILPEPTTEDPQVDVNDTGESPLFDPGIFGQDPPVCPSQSTVDPCMGDMAFVSDSIIVVDRISAVPDSLSINEDASPQTINVLANDINNTQGTLTISNPLGTPSLGGTVVNNGNNITYTPAPNAFGTETFSYSISNGLGDTSSADVTVTIAPVNDGPINTIPGSQAINEDNDLVFSGSALSVADIDADAGSGLTVNLSVGNGSLTVGSSGASVSGDGTGAVSVSGTVADVNGALNGLTYSPNLNYNGSDSLSVNTTDNGNFGSGGTLTDNDTVNITVNPINDAPVNTVPGPATLFNTETLAFTTGTDVRLWSGPFTVSDVDASSLEVTLTVTQGTLQLSGGTASNSITATGSVSSLNSQLGSLIYDPIDTFIGTDTLTMTTSDNGQTGSGGTLTDVDTVSITVTPPRVPFAASDLFQIEEDPTNALAFNLSQLLSNDLAPQSGTDTNVLSLTLINGLAPTASPFTTTQSGSLTYNPTSESFSYTPVANFFGLDTFTYTIESSPDGGNGASTGTVNIDVLPINDGPINTVPSPTRSVDEDQTLSFTGASTMISVADIDAGANGVTVTLTVNSGTVNVSTSGGGNVSNNGTGSVSIDGTVSQVNNSLGGLTYSPDPDFFGSDQLTVNTNDNGNTGGAAGNPTSSNPLSDTDTVNITIQPINDAPTIVVPGSQTFITDFDNVLDTTTPFQISDVDAGTDDVQVDLLIADGALTLSDTSSLSSVSGNGTNSVTLQGSVTNLNSALGSGITYRTTTSGNKTLSATINDLGNNGGVAGDPTANNPLSDSGDIAVEVLDFVPSNIGGFAFIDINNDANKGSNENGLEGVRITLNGTTFRNTPVSMEAFTGPTGSYLFSNLEPGDYMLGEVQPANLNNGTNSFTSPVVASGNDQANVAIPIAGNIDSRNNNFAERGLTTPFVTMFDLLDSQFQRSGALLSTNGSSEWSAFLGQGWEGYSNPRVDLVALTLTVADSGGTDRVVDLRDNDHQVHGSTYMNRIRSRLDRNDSDNQVIRVLGSAADFGLTGGGGEGEGDLADVQPVDSNEMYAQAVDRVFGDMA